MSADPDDIELAAYLAGDLDELACRRLEARLAEDPELGERLDRLHGVLLGLRGPDAVEPPPGLSERLSARLDEEPATGPSVSVSSPVGAEARPEAAPATRHGWLESVQRHLGTAAAVVVALVLLGGSFVLLSPQGSNDEAAEDAEMESAQDDAGAPGAVEDSGDDAADMDRPLSGDDGEAAGSDESAGEDAADSLDEGDSGDEAEESAPRALAADIPRAEAEEAADERWQALPTREAACRDEVEDAAPGPAVPVDVIESPSDPGVRVYEVVTVVGSGDTLDRAAWISVDPDSCDVVDLEVGE